MIFSNLKIFKTCFREPETSNLKSVIITLVVLLCKIWLVMYFVRHSKHSHLPYQRGKSIKLINVLPLASCLIYLGIKILIYFGLLGKAHVWKLLWMVPGTQQECKCDCEDYSCSVVQSRLVMPGKYASIFILVLLFSHLFNIY